MTPSYDTRLTALDRALVGEGNALAHEDIVTRARAFEEYLEGKPDQPPSEEAAVEKPKASDFKVGDLVTVSANATETYFGKECAATVISVGASDVRVRATDGTKTPAGSGSQYVLPENLAKRTAASDPRPFEVGDTVLVASGATFQSYDGKPITSSVPAPCVGSISRELDREGNYTLKVPGSRHERYFIHPSYLTLKEAAS